MHIPDDPLYYEKFISLPAISAFQFRHQVRARRCANLLGPVGIPKVRASPLSAVRTLFFIPPASAGIRTKKRNSAPLNSTPGKPFNADTPSPTGVYAAVINRVGFEGQPEKGDPGLEFWGNSFVADPFGQVISEASNNKEEILVVECDPAKSEETRRNWPFLRDRRIDAYQPILQRWLGDK